MTLIVEIACIVGLACGWWLFARTRTVPPLRKTTSAPAFSVVIPARNEAANLPRLLVSMRASTAMAAEVIVVDDASTDATALIAREHGAVVVESKQLPAGWTGKTWACWQGAQTAKSDLLMFLDADCYFAPEGLTRVIDWMGEEGSVAVSVLPYHSTQCWYEELSLFFNLMMAAGTGSFGAAGEGKLFGQSLIIRKELYERAGGHHAVRGERLEHLAMSQHVLAAGGRVRTAVGRGVLLMRMFPEGYLQLLESWKRSAATGASSTSVKNLLLAIAWLSGATTVFVGMACGLGWKALWMYLFYAIQFGWIARRLGSFRLLTVVAYPVPLLFYFGVFGLSLLAKRSGVHATWKGRQV